MQTQTAYAGFWLRAGAMMIDSFILSAAFAVGGIAVAMGLGAPDATGVAIAVVLFYVLGIAGSWLYFALMEASAGQATLGKRALGLIVTDLQGQRITVARAFGRMVSKLLNSLTFGIGWLVAAFTDRKQGLHDLVAGTLVVKKDPARNSNVALVVALCVASVPAVGIIAAIAIPGLLRARISGNEAAAISAMRSITAAQLSYFSRCGGYAPTLTALSSERAMLGPDFTASAVVTRSGYRFSMKASNAATPVADAPAGCEGAVSDYVALAAPVTPGTTGKRYFGTDSGATILEGDVSFSKTVLR